MKKYLTILILFFSFTASAQIVYTPMSAGGYQMKYLKIDSGFALPFRDTTIGRGADRPGLMVINPQDSLPYYYSGKFWKPVYVDSTGVIELINNKVDSVTVNGNNLFYWVAGLGYGAQLNKLDSIHVSADSIFTCIAGNCTFQYLTTAGTGTVTSIMAGFGLTGDTITTTGTIAVDTSVFHTSNWNNATYAPIVHFHSASDIISGTLPIARGGTGLSGIGGAGQSLRVATSGSALEYYTPPDVSGKVNYTDSGSIYVTPTQLSLSHTDSTAYHTASLNSDSTQLSLIRPNGTKDTIEVWADGFVPSGVQTVTGTAVDNTDPHNPVVNSSAIDTTSLSNRINQKVDSVRLSTDSLFAKVNGTWVFQFKSSAFNQWRTNGADIYYNTGNVGISHSSNNPSSLLEIRNDTLTSVPDSSQSISLVNKNTGTGPYFSPAIYFKANAVQSSPVDNKASSFRMYSKSSPGSTSTNGYFNIDSRADYNSNTPTRSWLNWLTLHNSGNTLDATFQGTNTFAGTTTFNNNVNVNATISSYASNSSFFSTNSAGFSNAGLWDVNHFGPNYYGFTYKGTINGAGLSSLNILRLVYINPTITNLTNTDLRAWENTHGNSFFGTTDGSVGIGATTTIDASSILQITSTTQGVLITRMTKTQRNAIASPAPGLMVIVTGEAGGEYLSWYNSSTSGWVKVTSTAD